MMSDNGILHRYPVDMSQLRVFDTERIGEWSAEEGSAARRVVRPNRDLPRTRQRPRGMRYGTGEFLYAPAGGNPTLAS